MPGKRYAGQHSTSRGDGSQEPLVMGGTGQLTGQPTRQQYLCMADHEWRHGTGPMSHADTEHFQLIIGQSG